MPDQDSTIEIRERLSRVEQKLDNVTEVRERLVRVETKLDFVGQNLESFNHRVSELMTAREQERGRSQLVKALIPLGSAVLGAGSIVMARLLHWIK